MKMLIRFFLLLVSFCFTGCIAISQASLKAKEDALIYNFVDVNRSEKAYILGDEYFLKAPLISFKRQYSWVRGAVPFFTFGGYTYVEISNNNDRYAYLSCSIEAFQTYNLMYSQKSFMSHMDFPFKLCHNLGNRDLSTAQAKPIPTWVKSFPRFAPTIDRCPANMRPIIPLYEVEERPNSLFSVVLSYSNLVIIDVPASIIMTLTGSIWYIPLGNRF